MNNLIKWSVAGAIFTLIIGSAAHFFYQWSGQNPLIAPFVPVNESTWEHLKLLVMPMLLFGIIEFFAYGKDSKGFITARFLSILFGMAVIVVSFYGYTSILGTNYLPLDIGTFVLGVLCAFLADFLLKKNCIPAGPVADIFAAVGIAALLVFFVLFTVQPPHCFLFEDPVTGGYGI